MRLPGQLVITNSNFWFRGLGSYQVFTDTGIQGGWHVSIAPIDFMTDANMMKGLYELDLSMIRMKLMDREEGQGWTDAHCLQIENEYLKYLALNRHYESRPIVPCKEVDIFWHYHILDTQAYSDDCQRIFGNFLHHFPYFGMRGPEDAAALGDAYDETLALYEVHFGLPDPQIWKREGMSRCPSCGRRCS